MSVDPLRILQIHNRYREPGGEDAAVAAERNLLRKAGHEVSLFDAENPSDPVGTASRLFVSPWNLASAARLRVTLQSTNPSVAHVHNTWFSISPAAIAELHRHSIPTVMTVHNYRLTCLNAQLFRQGAPCELCVGTHPWRGVWYRCYRHSFPASTMAATTLVIHRMLRTWTRVGLFLVLTRFMAEVMMRAGLASERVWVIPNFVDDPGLRPLPPSESDTILFVGRLTAEKGIDSLVESWDRARPVGLRLIVAGDGPLLTDLKRRETPGVSFLGSVSATEIRRLMLSARALAFPSVWYEGQPIVLLEAMAAGLPILANNVGGIGETTSTAGVLVNDWSEILRQVASAGLDVDELGRAARERWAVNFTPQGHLNNLMRAYHQVASFGKAHG